MRFLLYQQPSLERLLQGAKEKKWIEWLSLTYPIVPKKTEMIALLDILSENMKKGRYL